MSGVPWVGGWRAGWGVGVVDPCAGAVEWVDGWGAGWGVADPWVGAVERRGGGVRQAEAAEPTESKTTRDPAPPIPLCFCVAPTWVAPTDRQFFELAGLVTVSSPARRGGGHCGAAGLSVRAAASTASHQQGQGRHQQAAEHHAG
jgi:hypothetical protein